ncbi:LOW QUALITY PROTEIN: NHS-like protein 3 [Neosynchiropus ocellatus]
MRRSCKRWEERLAPVQREELCPTTRMARRRSTGDLVPWDITDVLVKETRAQRSQRKTGSSLGQAFSWLKGSRRKKNIGNGPYRNDVAVKDGKVSTKNHGSGKAGPKGTEDQRRLTVHFTSSQHYQENVFIEGSRPQFLEDLHIEAQEGLKILRQEENKEGVTTLDDESIASADIPEPDIGSKEDAGSPERNVASGNEESHAASTRPGLTRQGEEEPGSCSTFRPLNPVKRHDKNRKRNRRTTIMGIPNQVQKELALHRHSAFQQLPHQSPLDSSCRSGVLVIPMVDGEPPAVNREGARVHLSELEVDSKEDDVLKRHLQVLYKDDAVTNHRALSVLRPKSVAVPGMLSSCSFSSSMFSFLQEPQGPVMSISPQATYLSTIIPNAVLPASVDVIEIDCSSSSGTHSSTVGQGRSVRTVSKGSLVSLDSSLSPSLTRKLDVEGSQTNNSHNSTAVSSSPSHSDWSESQSSRTIVLNSSPTSSKSSESGGKSRRVVDQNCCAAPDIVSLHSSASVIGSPSTAIDNIFVGDESESSVTVTGGESGTPKRHCSRSLSIVKTKQPPPPPQRTHSLHSSRTRVDIRDPADGEHLDGSTSTGNIVITETVGEESPRTVTPVTPGRVDTACSCSLSQQSSAEARKDSGPPPQLQNHSPQTVPSEVGKFERTLSPSSGYSSQSGTPTLSPRETSPTSPDKQKQTLVKPERSAPASPSSSLTSMSSEVSSFCPHTHVQELMTDVATEEHKTILRLEVRELLHIPPPPRIKAPCPPPPETWVHNRRTFELLCGPSPDLNTVHIHNRPCKQAGTQTDISEVAFSERVETQVNVSETSDDAKLTPLTAVPEEPLAECRPDEAVKCLTEQSDKEETSSPTESDNSVAKTGPPAVILPAETPRVSSTDAPVEKNPSPMEERDGGVHLKMKVVLEENRATCKDEHPSDATLSRQSSTPPVTQQASSSVSSPRDPVEQVQEEVHAAESCWPPPPPPLEGVFDGAYESDFPPPPPPLMADCVLYVMDSCSSGSAGRQSAPVDDDLARNDLSEETSPELEWPSVQQKRDAETREYVDTFPEDLQNALSSLDITQLTTAPQDYPLSVIAFPSLSSKSVINHEDQPPFDHSTNPKADSVSVPLVPPLPVDGVTPGVSFRRQPNGATKDVKNKEILGRQKSAPTPKEDANIPLVTPSLLQMVRLRSVSMSEEQLKALSEGKSTCETSVAQERCQSADPAPQAVPQKPIRKSLSLKTPQTLKTSTPTSMRLQEAVRMKTAAMSSRDSLPCRITTRPLAYSNVPEKDAHRTSPSTASFVFSRDAKAAVTRACAPEDQANLKQNLVSEFMQLSGQSSSFFYGVVKGDRVPPPVAKKPVQSIMCSLQNPVAGSAESGVTGNGGGVQYQKETSHRLKSTTTRVTADTIETLF